MSAIVAPVKVAVRIRPISVKEVQEGSEQIVFKTSNDTLILNSASREKKYDYDWVFGPESTQKEVYNSVCESLVENVFSGRNATILAYGQSGSGKSYTMGTSSEPDSDGGIIPFCMHDIFEMRKKLMKDGADVSLVLSYLEIYNNDCYDLLSTRKKLNVRELNHKFYVEGLKQFPVEDESIVEKLIEFGTNYRSTDSTVANNTSSRSHAICTITIRVTRKIVENVDQQQQNENGDNDLLGVTTSSLIAKLNVVDLAGSERVNKSGAEGSIRDEGININKGLSVLRRVVTALSEKAAHVPYRESSLTKLLKDSLGGNGMTVMVACVSPADASEEDTVGTLAYADEASKIVNKFKVNMLRELANLDKDSLIKEIRRLRKDNKDLKQRIDELMESIMANKPNDMSALGVIEDHGADGDVNGDGDGDVDTSALGYTDNGEIDKENDLTEDDSEDPLVDFEESVYNEPFTVDGAAFVAEFGFTIEEAVSLHSEHQEAQNMLKESQQAFAELQDLVTRQHSCLLEMDEKMALQISNYQGVESLVESLRKTVSEKDVEIKQLRTAHTEVDTELVALRQTIADNDRIRDEDYKAYKTEQAHLVQAYGEQKQLEEAYKLEQARLIQANTRLLDLCNNLDGAVTVRQETLQDKEKRCKDLEAKLDEQTSLNASLTAANLELERLLTECRVQIVQRNDQTSGLESRILAFADQLRNVVLDNRKLGYFPIPDNHMHVTTMGLTSSGTAFPVPSSISGSLLVPFDSCDRKLPPNIIDMSCGVDRQENCGLGTGTSGGGGRSCDAKFVPLENPEEAVEPAEDCGWSELKD